MTITKHRRQFGFRFAEGWLGLPASVIPGLFGGGALAIELPENNNIKLATETFELVHNNE